MLWPNMNKKLTQKQKHFTNLALPSRVPTLHLGLESAMSMQGTHTMAEISSGLNLFVSPL